VKEEETGEYMLAAKSVTVANENTSSCFSSKDTWHTWHVSSW